MDEENLEAILKSAKELLRSRDCLVRSFAENIVPQAVSLLRMKKPQDPELDPHPISYNELLVTREKEVN